MAIFKDGQVLETDELVQRKLMQMGFGRKGEKGVRLHPLEAAYLVEKGLLAVTDGARPIAAMELLTEPPTKEAKVTKGKALSKASKLSKAKSAKLSKANSVAASPPLSIHPLSLHDQYLIFRALRQSGQVVRFSAIPLFWRVLAPGAGRDHERAQSLFMLTGQDWSASIDSLERQLAVARLMRLELVFAYVKDGRPHLVKVSKPPLEG